MSKFIREKLSLARTHLESARRNIAEADTETASNRVFLAAENAAAAAIAKAGEHIRPRHGLIRSQFEDLCDKGIVPERFRNVLIESYRFRLRGDYGRRRYEGQITPEMTPEAVQKVIDIVSDPVAVVEEITVKRRSAQV